MSFYHRYELVKLVRNGEPKTFQAREIQSSRGVLLHLWGVGAESRRAPLLLRLRDLMRNDPAAAVGTIIEVQETAEPPYAVTVFEEGFDGLEAWLGTRFGVAGPSLPTAPATPPASPAGFEPTTQTAARPLQPQAALTQPLPPMQPPPPPAPPKPAPGEFTRLFEQPAALPQQPPAPPKPEPGEFTRQFASPAAPAAPPAPAQKTEPGEFTRLFEQPAAPPPAPPAATPSRGPSQEFDRLFGGPVPAPVSRNTPTLPQFQPAATVQPPKPPVAPPPAALPAQPMPPAPAPASKPAGDDEFAKFFGSPLGSNPLPVEEIERGVVAPPPQAPQQKPFRGPTDFTLQFGPRQGSPQAPPEAPVVRDPTARGATSIFARDNAALNASAGGAPVQAGPSEFTRVLQGPQFQQPGGAGPSTGMPMAPGGVPLPAPPRKNRLLGVVVGVLACFVLLLLIAVVVLLFRH